MRDQHVGNVNAAIVQLDKVRALLAEASTESDLMMDLLESALGPHPVIPCADQAYSGFAAVRVDITALHLRLTTVRTELADYLTRL